jgi:hypothetical protein
VRFVLLELNGVNQYQFAVQPIDISPKASHGMKVIANKLGGYLWRITGAKFEIEVGDGSHRMVLRTLAEFPTHGVGYSPFKSGIIAEDGTPGGVMTQRNPTCDVPVPIAPLPRPPGM